MVTNFSEKFTASMCMPLASLKKETVCYCGIVVRMYQCFIVTTKAAIVLKKNYSFVSSNPLCKPEQ